MTFLPAYMKTGLTLFLYELGHRMAWRPIWLAEIVQVIHKLILENRLLLQVPQCDHRSLGPQDEYGYSIKENHAKMEYVSKKQSSDTYCNIGTK